MFWCCWLFLAGVFLFFSCQQVALLCYSCGLRAGLEAFRVDILINKIVANVSKIGIFHVFSCANGENGII